MRYVVIPNSRNLKGMAYHHGTMYIEFAKGVYEFTGVQPTVVTDILFAEDSQGQAFNQLKPLLGPYRKLTDEEIEELEFAL